MSQIQARLFFNLVAERNALRNEVEELRRQKPPREPTSEMISAGTVAHRDSPVFEAARIVSIWRAMYDAALRANSAAAAHPDDHYFGFSPQDTERWRWDPAVTESTGEKQ